MMSRTGLFVVLLSAAGCYKYEPLEVGSVTPQTLVRARLSVSEAEQLKSIIPSENRVVSGLVVEANPSQLLLELPSARRAQAAGLQVLHQRVAISRAGIVELESKKLDRLKTGLLAGAGAAGIVSILFAANVIDTGGEGQPRPEPLPEFRIPLFRLR